MADEEQGTPSNGAQAARPVQTSGAADTVTVALVVAPEIPEQIAGELADELPDLLSQYLDDRVCWTIPVIADPLMSSEQDESGILDMCQNWREQNDWDYAISLTDLPIYRERQIVVADVSAARKIGQISLPALGVLHLRQLAREIALQIVSELYGSRPEPSQSRAGESGEALAFHGPRTQQSRGVQLIGLLAPIQHHTTPDADMKAMNLSARYVAVGVRGHLRLWAGLVYANHPLRLFIRFKGTIAAAFATGAYGLIFPTLWQLADAAGLLRLLIMMVTSITAMIAWLIVGHNLWERSSELEPRPLAALYNGITVLTLTAAVVSAYVVLFALFLLTVLIVVPSSLLQSTLQRPIGIGDYIFLAWVASSVATVAGALGSGLEDSETVRDAAFGHRQKRRYEEYME